MKVYQAMYCDCIHESAYGTISIHKTKEGAEKALRLYLSDRCYEIRQWETILQDIFCHEDWMINETTILD